MALAQPSCRSMVASSGGGQAQQPFISCFKAGALWIDSISVLLTLIGLVAALWHVAWWIGVLFLIVTIISLGIVIVALSAVRTPQTQEERARKQRYAEEMIRQAQEQAEATTRRAQQQAEEVTRRELEGFEKNNERAEPPH